MPESPTSTVSTVRGPVPVADLGRTLIHEHIFCLTSEVLATGLSHHWDEDAMVERAVQKLTSLKAAGIDTLVDCTVTGLGRRARAVQRVAEKSPVNIISATGLYAVGGLPFFFSFRGPGTPIPGDDPMDELFLRELDEGLDGTGIIPAFLKCAVESNDPDSQLNRPIAAVARVSAERGTPVQVHTDVFQQTGLLAIDVLKQNGADLSHVVIGHSGDSNDLDYLKQVFDSGAFVGFDRFGIDFYNSTDARIETLLKVIEAGYVGQIVLSHDAHTYNDVAPTEAAEATMAAMLPNHHYNFIPETLVPTLRERGVSEADIDTMLVANPARFFGGK
jgi:phosphotriesterase-related protein